MNRFYTRTALFCALFALLPAAGMYAADFSSNAASGNWNDPLSWAASIPGSVPGLNDNVFIRNNHEITIPSNEGVQCNAIQVQTGKLTIEANAQLTVQNSTTLPSTNRAWDCTGTLDAADTSSVIINNYIATRFEHPASAGSFGRLEINSSGDIDQNFPITAKELKITATSTGRILFGSQTNKVSTVSLQAARAIKFKAVPNGSSFFTVLQAQNTATSEGIDIETTQGIKLAPTTNIISSGGAIKINAGGLISPTTPGNAITIAAATTTIQTTSGTIDLLGNILSEGLLTNVTITTLGTINISGKIGENSTSVFNTDALNLTAASINVYGSMYLSSAATTTINGAATAYPDSLTAGIPFFTLKTGTLNIPASKSLSLPAAPPPTASTKLRIKTDTLTVDGTLNARTGTMELSPCSATYSIILGNTGIIPPPPSSFVYFNTSIFGTRITANSFTIGDTVASSMEHIYVTNIGSTSSRFNYPLTLNVPANKNIYFKKNIYTSKSLTIQESVSTLSTAYFDADLTIDLISQAGITLTNNLPTQVLSAYSVTILSQVIIFNGRINGGPTTELTLKNHGSLMLLGDVTIGKLTQDGLGNSTLAGSSISVTNQISFLTNIMLSSGTNTTTFQTTSATNGTINIQGNITRTPSSQNYTAVFNVPTEMNLTVAGTIGEAAARFLEVRVMQAKNVIFNGIVYTQTFLQEAGSGYTWFKSDLDNSIYNFDFSGTALTTKKLSNTITGVLKVANSGIWRSGNWTTTNDGISWSLAGGSEITWPGITQTGLGGCYLSGQLVSNSNIQFTGDIYIYTNALNIRNNAGGQTTGGLLEFAGFFRDIASYAANLSIKTAASPTSNMVKISGNLGDSNRSLGIVEIEHAGTLTLGLPAQSIDIYAQRFHQMSAGVTAELNVQNFITNGTSGTKDSGTGGIVFIGTTVLKRAGLITFQTGVLGLTVLHFDGPVTGNSNILITNSMAAIVFNQGIGSPSIGGSPADVHKIGFSSGTLNNIPLFDANALEIRNIHSSSPAIEINGPIYSKGPLFLQPFSSSHDIKVRDGDILVDEYTYNSPALPTKFHAKLILVNVENIIVGNDIEFKYVVDFAYEPVSDARVLRIESTKEPGGTITNSDTIQSSRNNLELITKGEGTVRIKYALSPHNSEAYNLPNPIDVLYIKTGTLILDNSSQGFNIFNGGINGIRHIMRFVVKKKIDFTGTGQVRIKSASGASDIYIQPWDADQNIYLHPVDFTPAAADPNGLYIHAYLFTAMRAKRVFIGCPKYTAGSNAATHGYMTNQPEVNNLTIWDGTANFYIGGGTLSLNENAMNDVSKSYNDMYDLYLFSPNGTEVQFRYGAAATTGISLYAGKHLYINAPNAAITSNRTGTGADIVVKNYISNDRTNEGSLFIKAKSAGTPDRPLVINAPNMGSAAIMAAELTGTASGTTDGSMYIKNIYFPGSVPPLPVKIWKIQSANQTDGTISLYNSSAGIEQPAQAGGIAAEHLHISAAREINLTTNNTIKKTVTLEGSFYTSDVYDIAFTNTAGGNLVASAKNHKSGSITLTEKSGDLTIDTSARPAMFSGNLIGLEGGGAICTCSPKPVQKYT